MKKTSVITEILNTIGQLVTASILWGFCCLPMFTIGPACTAMYYCVVKAVRRERGTVWETFFHAFKTNFWQSVGWNLALLTYYGLLAFLAVLRIRASGGFVLDTVMGAIIALAFLVGWMLPFLYPVISRFFHKGLALLRFLLYIGMRYLWVTVISLVLLAAAGILCITNSTLILFLPGIYTLILSFMLEPIFKSLSTDDGSDSYDEWYSEPEYGNWTERLSAALSKKKK